MAPGGLLFFRSEWRLAMNTTTKLVAEENSMGDLEHNKQTVIAFYMRAFTDHEPADAVAKYVGAEYIQHNPDTPSGAAAFVESATGVIAEFPQIKVEIKRVIAEGDMVVAHNLIKTSLEDRGMAGADIFRLRDGKIVEHWDVRQPVPEATANDNTMF
jgi:predicted SnoaL-like aldol condensation-catalyzing enzyme